MKSNIFKTFSLKGKTVILTGGFGFLGLQYTTTLGQAGANLVIWDLKDDDILQKIVRRIRKETKIKILAQSVDITDETAVQRAVNEVLKKFKTIDVLINNAALNPGIGEESKKFFSPYEKYPIDLWKKEFDVNVHGAMICIKAVAPHMMKNKKGAILNVSSGVSVGAYDNRTYTDVGWSDRYKSIAYTTSKTAIVGLTRQWAEYLGKYGIRVNAFSPGGVQPKKIDLNFVKSYAHGTMLNRMAQIGEYGPVILFLCSDASSYMTGANVIVDGGKSAW
ncbi:MAG TPA: SDR family oxidoreductase [Candidatus Paceibacterota bacterium]|nr:SDR family oxidoreductase [Candidatus Paceibacterota bacterium]